ncbi:MAG: undecaprenyl-phosphate galactose phosphotransferase WbaP, partial [Phycisphaeraceae bacterium]|nr:undecaprenyl-phosphate galactose phosphotransferase WbaP [Phycisphaeraceae bacterium]
TLVLGMVIFLGRMTGVSRFIFLGGGLAALLLVPLARSLVRFGLARYAWWGRPVAVVGSTREAAALIRALEARPGLGLRPVVVLVDEPSDASELHGVLVAGTIEKAGPIIERWGLRQALIAVAEISRGRMGDLVARTAPHFRRTVIVPYRFRLNQYQLNPRDYEGLLGLETRQPLDHPLWSRLKRTMDLAITLLLLPVALPIMALAAIAIRLETSGPVIYQQERLGRDGKHFKVLKLRSMYMDAEARLQDMLASDPELAREYERMHKLRDDPRITRVGRFIRRTSIDELPQLINVLLGEMSLVGPRPYVPREKPDMAGVEDVILRVRPGITGYWQTFDRNRASFHQRLQMDVHYVRNWSPWVDFFLLARTIPVLLVPRHAH